MWKVKTYVLVEADEPELYDSQGEAGAVANHIMVMQPDEVYTRVVECDANGEEV